MGSQLDSSVILTDEPEACVSPADKSQRGHAITAPEINVVSEDLSEVSAVGDPTTLQKEVAKENSPPPQEEQKNDKIPAPVSPSPPSQRNEVVADSSELEAADFLSRIMRETIEGNPATPQKAPERHLTPSPVLPTPFRPVLAIHILSTESTQLASTLCQDKRGEGTPSAPKRPRSPTPPRDPDGDSPRILALKREFVFDNVFHGVKAALQNVVDLCGMRLGSRKAAQTRFEPDVDDIKQGAMRPTATLQQIADVTESIMLCLWKGQCKRFIVQYRLDMRRDLSEIARRDAWAAKEKVLADAALFATAGFPHPAPSPHTPRASTPQFPEPFYRPQTPSQPRGRAILIPHTPHGNNRGAAPEVEALRPRIERLDIGDYYTNVYEDPPLDTPPSRKRRLNVSDDPHNSPPATRARHTPRGRRHGNRAGLRRTPAPRMTMTSPSGSQYIGPYLVATPQAQPTVESSPRANISKDDPFV
ncbi:hypothetical protein F5Y13DRAFT_185276 [Hypoxylon sp. FL1857]|nr:hypothetical protein F5Y13DRAFT_185276 [Hypoxylon sp. FL1857]